MEIWETEEQFISSLEKLKSVIPFSDYFSIGYTNSIVDGKLSFQSYLGSHFNIHAVIHELSHFIVHDYEYAFVHNWGLRNPNLYFSGISIDPGPSNNDNPIKLEIKVWAVQFLIECMCGFRNISDDIPEHEEVVYVNDGKYLNNYDKIKPFIMSELQKEVDRLKNTDYENDFIKKINGFDKILEEKEKYIETEKFVYLKRHNIKRNDKITKCKICLISNNGWYSVILELYENKDLICSDEAVITRNIEKAEKVYKHCIKINTM